LVGEKMGEFQEDIVDFMKELKFLEAKLWGIKIGYRQISPFSNNKFDECALLLDKCFDNLADVRTLEAVEQRYDPS